MKNKDGKDYPTQGQINVKNEPLELIELNPPQYINGFLVRWVLVSKMANPQPLT